MEILAKLPARPITLRTGCRLDINQQPLVCMVQRRTRLDELPQLRNLPKCETSLSPLYHIGQFKPEFRALRNSVF
jgi:hypothetical protein